MNGRQHTATLGRVFQALLLTCVQVEVLRFVTVITLIVVLSRTPTFVVLLRSMLCVRREVPPCEVVGMRV